MLWKAIHAYICYHTKNKLITTKFYSTNTTHNYRLIYSPNIKKYEIWKMRNNIKVIIWHICMWLNFMVFVVNIVICIQYVYFQCNFSTKRFYEYDNKNNFKVHYLLVHHFTFFCWKHYTESVQCVKVLMCKKIALRFSCTYCSMLHSIRETRDPWILYTKTFLQHFDTFLRSYIKVIIKKVLSIHMQSELKCPVNHLQ